MNPNNPHNWEMGNFSPHYPHVNPVNLHWNLQWNQAKPGASTVRGNVVHVNPAFFQPKLTSLNGMSNPQKIIVNPKFFPHVQNETTPSTGLLSPTQDVLYAERIPPFQINHVSNLKSNKITNPQKSKATSQTILNVEKPRQVLLHNMKPSPIRHVGDRSKLTKLHFISNPSRSKYKWRKIDSPLKSVTIKHAYKLVRKASVAKSPKITNMLTLRAQHDIFMMLTPPKLTSTPIETQPSNSRFKLDNRVRNKKKAIKNSSSRSLLPKILHNKYQFIRNKCLKSNNLNLAKFAINRSVNRSFTNFKSPLCRPLLHHSSRLQRMVNAVKPNRSIKKTKSTKNKTRKRYYDGEAKAKLDDEVLDDIEIAEKPSGPKIRTPLGALPSFITL